MIIAPLLLVLATTKPCVWKAPKPVKTESKAGGFFHFERPIDAAWYSCVRRADHTGTLTVRTFLHDGAKKHLLSTQRAWNQNASFSLQSNDVCGKRPAKGPRNMAAPHTDAVSVELIGSGNLKPLSGTFGPFAVQCPRCRQPSSDSMSMAVRNAHGRFTRGAKTLLTEVWFDKDWHRCAREGSTLELRFFAADSDREVEKATEPVLVIPGFEKSHHARVKFPKKKLCRARRVGYEFVGTGEMKMAQSEGMQVLEASLCAE